MLKPFRRVVTGHNAEGKSTVVFDGVAQQGIENPLWPGRGATGLWRTDKSMSDNLGNADPTLGSFRLQPIDGGTNFLIAHVMPSSDLDPMTPEQRERIYKETMHAVGTPEARVDTLKHPGMHKTKTIDYLVVLSGEVTLLLEDGEVDLKPLDVVVQRGTNHAWINRGRVPAFMAAVLVDAQPLAEES
jgi:mannose-6-phosphate isomerase-like protein (cupin superfamily)